MEKPISNDRLRLKGSVFLGVREIAGYYARLEKGFHQIGVRCHRVDLWGHAFGYAKEKPRHLLCRWANALGEGLSAWSGNVLGRVGRRAVITAVQVPLFLWAAATHRYFVFGWADSLLPWNLDLPVLRLLRKRIVFVYHGSDSRPPYLDFGNVLSPQGEKLPVAKKAEQTQARFRRVRRVSRYADWVIDNPLSAHFQPTPFVNWFAVGMPVLGVDPEGVDRSGENAVPRILHCPSNLRGKGTFEIRDIIDQLRRDGLEFEYVEISGRPHDEVIEEIRRSDFVIDQLYCDTPLAGFASEAASYGKAAVVGIHDLDRVEVAFPAAVKGAICEPRALVEKIRELVSSVERRREAGRKAYGFIQQWTPEKVAERMATVLGEGPKREWVVETHQGASAFGWGLPEEASRESIADMVQACGESGLCLDDQPELKAAMLQRVRVES